MALSWARIEASYADNRPAVPSHRAISVRIFDSSASRSSASSGRKRSPTSSTIAFSAWWGQCRRITSRCRGSITAMTSAQARSRVVSRRAACEAVPTDRTSCRPVRPCSSRNSVSAARLRATFSVHTNSTFTAGLRPPASSFRDPARLDELLADPVVRPPEAFLEADDRLPAQDLAQARVVAVASSHALRLGQVVLLLDVLAGDLGHDVDQLVDRDHTVLTEVERLAKVRPHQPGDALHAVVDVAVGPRLLAIAPHVDHVLLLGEGDLAADGRRRLLATAVVGPERAEDVVEADRPGLEAEVVGVVAAHPLGVELLPAIAVLGAGRVGVFFLERRDVGLVLEVARVDAGRRRVEEPGDAVDARRIQRVDVDQHVVAADLGLVGMDEADAAHVRRQGIHLVDAAGRGQAVVPATQIEIG